MRAMILAAGLALLVVAPPGAQAADTTHTFYFHEDGTLDTSPGSGGERADRTYEAPPADDEYVLRAGSVLHVRTAGILHGGVSATLYRNDKAIGDTSAGGELLRLMGSTATLVFDNPETRIREGDVLSVRVDGATGLLGGTTPEDIVMTRAPIPAPAAPPAAPAPQPPAAPAPPAPTPQAPSVVATAPQAPSTPVDGAPQPDGGSADDDITTTSSSTPPEWLASVQMPWESATGALLLMLLAAAALGGWTIVRLGRI